MTPPKKLNKTGPRKSAAKLDTPAHLVGGADPDHLDGVGSGDQTDDGHTAPDEAVVASAGPVPLDAEHQGEQRVTGAMQFVEDVPRRFPGAPKDGIVLAPDEPVRVRGVVIGREVHLSAPVYRAAMPQRSQRWVFQQLHARGAVVDVALVQVVTDERE